MNDVISQENASIAALGGTPCIDVGQEMAARWFAFLGSGSLLPSLLRAKPTGVMGPLSAQSGPLRRAVASASEPS